MVDVPTFSDAEDAAETAKSHGRKLLPWLPTPPDCEQCGAMMYASETYDPQEVRYVRSWKCKECGVEIYRNDPGVGDPEQPRRLGLLD